MIGGLDCGLDTSAKSLYTGLDNCSLLICRLPNVPNVAGTRNSTIAVKIQSHRNWVETVERTEAPFCFVFFIYD